MGIRRMIALAALKKFNQSLKMEVFVPKISVRKWISENEEQKDRTDLKRILKLIYTSGEEDFYNLRVFYKNYSLYKKNEP